MVLSFFVNTLRFSCDGDGETHRPLSLCFKKLSVEEILSGNELDSHTLPGTQISVKAVKKKIG